MEELRWYVVNVPMGLTSRMLSAELGGAIVNCHRRHHLTTTMAISILFAYI